MFTLTVVFFITIINLFKMITEDGIVFYKDIRVWVVLASLIALIGILATSQNI